ncbi:MAG: DNA topoisomerase IB [Sphingobium sp.]|uniref:DNA topoisomerase IB n=1 Tax=Sphingobium sp. TaxID=1912891 RepID=UPI0029A6168B|nr:DNA topoisomerase IB [Sphingobium sp.]MDX3911216.1 DNA topoisomerase IB [Sphingobium sp.]
MKEPAAIPIQTDAEKELVFVSDDMPGISRRKSGKGMSYRGPDGAPIKDKATLARIRALAIPPAYTDVWICPLPNGHLQATGRDARGRKQYRYHADFRAERDRSKYGHVIEFAQALPRIRERVRADMGLRGLPREKVLATVVHLLDISMVRVGNIDYAKQNASYGLTTLRNRHVAVEGSSLRMKFKGKSGKPWDITIKDRRVARLIKAVQELPGQHLFQYLDDDGTPCEVTSGDVNAYLKEISGADITAKDFRTWHGTVTAALELAACPPSTSNTAAKRQLVAAIDRVASRLGNTRSVCRACYIHPAVMDRYMDGKLDLRIPNTEKQESNALDPGEVAVLKFLRRHVREEALATAAA